MRARLTIMSLPKPPVLLTFACSWWQAQTARCENCGMRVDSGRRVHRSADARWTHARVRLEQGPARYRLDSSVDNGRWVTALLRAHAPRARRRVLRGGSGRVGPMGARLLWRWVARGCRALPEHDHGNAIHAFAEVTAELVRSFFRDERSSERGESIVGPGTRSLSRREVYRLGARTKPSGLPRRAGGPVLSGSRGPDAEDTISRDRRALARRVSGKSFPLVCRDCPTKAAARKSGDHRDAEARRWICPISTTRRSRAFARYRDRLPRSRARGARARSCSSANRGRRAGSHRTQCARADRRPRVRAALHAPDARCGSRTPICYRRTLDDDGAGDRAWWRRARLVTLIPYASARAHEVRSLPPTRREARTRRRTRACWQLASH